MASVQELFGILDGALRVLDLPASLFRALEVAGAGRDVGVAAVAGSWEAVSHSAHSKPISWNVASRKPVNLNVILSSCFLVQPTEQMPTTPSTT